MHKHWVVLTRMMAVWINGNSATHINKITLCWRWWVLLRLGDCSWELELLVPRKVLVPRNNLLIQLRSLECAVSSPPVGPSCWKHFGVFETKEHISYSQAFIRQDEQQQNREKIASQSSVQHWTIISVVRNGQRKLLVFKKSLNWEQLTIVTYRQQIHALWSLKKFERSDSLIEVIVSNAVETWGNSFLHLNSMCAGSMSSMTSKRRMMILIPLYTQTMYTPLQQSIEKSYHWSSHGGQCTCPNSTIPRLKIISREKAQKGQEMFLLATLIYFGSSPNQKS